MTLLIGVAMGFVASLLVIFGAALYALFTGSKQYGGLRVLTFPQIAGGVTRIGIELDVRKASEISATPASFAKANWYFTPVEALAFAVEIRDRAMREMRPEDFRLK